jgi:Neocarzinostatin family
MSGIGSFRMKMSAVAVAAGLLSGGVAVTTLAGATTTPHLVVTPVTGLHNGSIVRVSGTGFKAGDTLYIVQCIWKAQGQPGCKVALPVLSVTVSSTGTFPVKRFKVTTGVIGNGKCGTKATNLKNCEVSAGNITGGDSAVTRIQFIMPRG